EDSTLESAFGEDATLESAFGQDSTMETPTVESPGPGLEGSPPKTQQLRMLDGGTAEMPAAVEPGEHTEEIDLDDLGLTVEDLTGLQNDIGELPGLEEAEADTREQPSYADDDDLLAASGVTE